MNKNQIVEHLMTVYLSKKPAYIFEHTTNDYESYVIEIYLTSKPEDKEYISKNRRAIKKFMDDGYENAGLGSFVGCFNADSVKRNTAMLKVARDVQTDEIIAMSIYSSRWGGLKCVGGTVLATDDARLHSMGVESLKQIIREDVKALGDFVWIECSGAIEHMWEKYGGIKIPSAYLPIFMDEKTLLNVSPVDDDPYTYYRTVAAGTDDELRIEKKIFGFPNRQVMEQYIKDKNMTLEKLCKQYNIDPETIVNESFKYRDAPRHLWPYLKIVRYFYGEFMRGRLELTSEESKMLKKSIVEIYGSMEQIWKKKPANYSDGLVSMLTFVSFDLNRSITLKIYELGDMLETEQERFPTIVFMPTAF